MKTKSGELSVNVTDVRAARQGAAAAAREVARARRHRHALPPALRRPHRERRSAARVRRSASRRSPRCARSSSTRGFVEVETPVLHPIPGGADRAAVRHAPQRARHRPVPAHRARAVPEAADRRRLRPGVRDRPRVPQRGPVDAAQPRVHDARAVRGVRRLHRHDGAHRGADRRRRARPRSARRTVEWDGATVDLTPPFERRTMIDLVKEHAGRRRAPVAAGRGPAQGLRRPRRPVRAALGLGQARARDLREDDGGEDRRARRSCATTRARSRRSRATHRDDPTLTERFELIVARPRARQRLQRAERPGRPAAPLRGAGRAQAARRRRGARRRRRLRARARVRPAADRRHGHRHRPAGHAAGRRHVDPRGDPVPAPAPGGRDRSMSRPRRVLDHRDGRRARHARRAADRAARRGPTEVVGVDFVPPRRRLRRAEFRRIDPRDRDRLAEFVEDFAPTVVAHFGVYEPASRMTPGVGDRAHRAVHDRDAERGRARRQPRVRRRCAAGSRSTARVRCTASVPDEDVMPAPRDAVRPVAARGRGDRRGRARCATASPVCALRYAPVVGSHVPEPARAVAAPPASCRCPRSPTRRSRCCTPTTPPRRWSPRSSTATTDRCNVVGPGAATPWQAVRLGGRVPLPVLAADVGRGRARRPRSRAPRSRRTSSSCCATAAPATAAARVDALGLTRPACRRRQVLRELFEWADVVPIPTEPRGGGVTRTVASRDATDDRLEVDRDRRRTEPLVTATLRRRLGGRYPVDPFGLDPQLADLVRAPFVRARRPRRRRPAASTSRRRAGGARREPRLRRLRAGRARRRGATRDRSPAARRSARPLLPSSAACAVASARSARSAPRPARRVCAPVISSAVPLAPTWLRTGAGTPPLPLMQAMTHAPIDPRRGHARRTVRHCDPPVARALRSARHARPIPTTPATRSRAARFAEAVRDAVSQLLVEP